MCPTIAPTPCNVVSEYGPYRLSEMKNVQIGRPANIRLPRSFRIPVEAPAVTANPVCVTYPDDADVADGNRSRQMSCTARNCGSGNCPPAGMFEMVRSVLVAWKKRRVACPADT